MTSAEAQGKLKQGEVITHPECGTNILICSMLHILKKYGVNLGDANIEMPVIALERADAKVTSINLLDRMSVFDMALFDIYTDGWEILEKDFQKQFDVAFAKVAAPNFDSGFSLN